MSLTDDMKTGQLPSKNYWVKLINDDIIVSFFNGLEFSCCKDFGIREVLAPCDYDELLRLKEENKRMSYDLGNQGHKIKNQRHEINNRRSEINKLQNLLGELKDRFMAVTTNIPLNMSDLELIGRINAAIGESEER